MSYSPVLPVLRTDSTKIHPCAKMYFVGRCSQHEGGESLACLKTRKVLLSKELHQTYKKKKKLLELLKYFYLFVCF